MANPSRVPSLIRLDMVVSQASDNGSVMIVPGATVKIFAQGATPTNSAGFTISANVETAVPVYHTGATAEQGTLYVNGDGSKALPVTKVMQGGAPSITVKPTASVVVPMNARFMVAVPNTQFFSDPLGGPLSGLGDALIAPANTARVTAYVADRRYDLLISGVSDSPRILKDLVGGWVMRG